MIVGSDNLNIRSWTNDSELSCAVIDERRDEREPADPGGLGDGARVLARETRLRLWREHLGREPDDDADLVDGVAAIEVLRQRPPTSTPGATAVAPGPGRPAVSVTTGPARYAGGRSGGRSRSTGCSSTPTAAPGAPARRLVLRCRRR